MRKSRDDEGELKANLHLQLTWADLYFTAIIDYLNYLAKQDLTANHENLRSVVNNVLSIDSIASWVSERPRTEI